MVRSMEAGRHGELTLRRMWDAHACECACTHVRAHTEGWGTGNGIWEPTCCNSLPSTRLHSLFTQLWQPLTFKPSQLSTWCQLWRHTKRSSYVVLKISAKVPDSCRAQEMYRKSAAWSSWTVMYEGCSRAPRILEMPKPQDTAEKSHRSLLESAQERPHVPQALVLEGWISPSLLE